MPVMQVPSTPDKVVIVGEFPHCPPHILFDYWTMPRLITLWWSKEAEIDARLDGTYHLSWPKRKWHLRGRYTTFDPGKELAFTWKWDHLPSTTQVNVTFEPLPDNDNGTKLTVTQSPYSDSTIGQVFRQSHLEGWLYFIGRLQNIEP